ncbi:type VI secretion system Vgr family protein [Cronobacter dublinensis]
MDAQDKLRSTGFELRTDEHGVIPAAKGLLICADGQPKATGEVLDRETALQEIAICLEQLAQLSVIAEAANALQADIDSQREMFYPQWTREGIFYLRVRGATGHEVTKN